MSIERIKGIAKWTFALALVFALLPALGLAENTARLSLDEQLIQAAQKGDLAAVKELLAKGADIDTDVQVTEVGDGTPLSWASYYGRADVVKFLLDKERTSMLKVLTVLALWR